MDLFAPLGLMPRTRPMTVTELLHRVQKTGYDLYTRDIFDRDASPELVAAMSKRKGGWAVYSQTLGGNGFVTIDDNVRVALTNHLFNFLEAQAEGGADADTI